MGSPKNASLNNPGNIRKSADGFQGEVLPSKSAAFKTFETPAYGFRAMAVILLTYFSKYGANTISKIITRYAPPSENKTDSYIKFVAEKTGINKDTILKTSDFSNPGTDPLVRKIVRAMAHLEQGKAPSEIELAKGYTQFLKDKLS